MAAGHIRFRRSDLFDFSFFVCFLLGALVLMPSSCTIYVVAILILRDKRLFRGI
jgi:hypothetical protein